MRNPLRPAARILSGLGATRANMLVIGIIYGIYAASLICQPARWALTPAYANLLVIMPQQAWGACFAAVTVLLGAAVRHCGPRWLPVTAISAGLAITTFWCAAFVIRWLTSSNTTPETWTSWAAFDFLLLRALFLLGYEEVRVRRPRDRPGDG